MTSRERFLKALNCERLDRPPVWVMRQAGRYLPEYRKLKEKYSFLELAQNPALAVEVSLQPMRRYALDAAIVFSDILVIPEALGQPYFFKDAGGISMAYRLENASDIQRLDGSEVCRRLSYVGEAIAGLRSELGNEKALLGFGGSPWTLAAYMVEGEGSKHWHRVKAFYWDSPELFEVLMEKLVQALSDYFLMQIEQGVDAIQIFDSWGAACPGDQYWDMSLKWIQQLVARLPEGFPIILYAKGMSEHTPAMERTGVKAISLDWTVPLKEKRKQLSDTIALQGNLDPAVLDTTPELVKSQALQLLAQMKGSRGHIFNLGHGIHPTATPDNMAVLIDTVVNFSN